MEMVNQKERVYVFDPATPGARMSELPLKDVVSVDRQGMQEILTLKDGSQATVELRGLRMVWVKQGDVDSDSPVSVDSGGASVQS